MLTAYSTTIKYQKMYVTSWKSVLPTNQIKYTAYIRA